MLEARKRVFDADAQGREALIEAAALRGENGTDARRVDVRAAPAGLDAAVSRVRHVAQQEQPLLQEDVAREVERG
jgi:hypothetical protein